MSLLRKLLHRSESGPDGEPGKPARKRGPEPTIRPVRLALVMNGGVSLAVWIGGVTHELDCLRRAYSARGDELSAEKTTRCYNELLEILHERVLIDVIAGTSAGGINGALLAAAVYAQRPLPSLRDVWIEVGDFSNLLRSPSRSQPPSLLRGDEFVLPKLEEHFEQLLRGVPVGPDDPIYLYVTGTDFYGVGKIFVDSTQRQFQELDHRRVFQFQHVPGDPSAGGNSDKPARRMPKIGRFDLPNAPNLLARAARSSSSFPVAFEAHGLKFADEPGTRWLIDGGVLDNQPFNPVLNRIATIATDEPVVHRVLGYVVPYVTEAGTGPPASGPTTAMEQPTAKQTADAAGKLPRDLPKLLDLERVRVERNEADRFYRAQERFDALNGYELEELAKLLFKTYRRTREDDCAETFAQWASKTFQPGAGEIGQLETIDVEAALAEWAPSPPTQQKDSDPWLPAKQEWNRNQKWEWGLSPSERIARDALLRLRRLRPDIAEEDTVSKTIKIAGELVETIRALKFKTSKSFHEDTDPDRSLIARARRAYEATGVVKELTNRFGELAERLDETHALPQVRQLVEGDPERLEIPRLQFLIDAEIVQNAFYVSRPAVPPVFTFLHMSAGSRNALNHPDHSPETKLAGMKLNHFAGFLKRSWRANDWMWGRLDAAQYLVTAVLDLPYLKALAAKDTSAFARLGEFAFTTCDEPALTDAWEATLRWAGSRKDLGEDLDKRVRKELDEVKEQPPQQQFVSLLCRARDKYGTDKAVGAALLDCCRAQLAARIQLDILAEELPMIAEAIGQDLERGASRGSSGAEWRVRHTGRTAQERVRRFQALRIGKEEDPVQEASSKLGMDVASTTAAVGVAAFSGSHGGLPAPIRAPLASLRGLTLAFNIIVRLLVRTPAVGIAAVVAAAVAVVWALARPNTILTAALPGLAAVAIGGAAVLITMATSPLEARCRRFWQGVGLLTIIAVPVALLLFVLGLPLDLRDDLPWLSGRSVSLGGAAKWLRTYVTDEAVDIAGCIVLGALAAALVRLFFGSISRRLRIVDLWIYRWCLLLAGGAIAGGAAYEKVNGHQAKWNGTILFLILFGAISLSPLIGEVAEGIVWSCRFVARKVRRK